MLYARKATASPLSALTLAATGLFLGLSTPAFAETYSVGSVAELQNAVSKANAAGGNSTILLADGSYTLPETLYINAPKVTIASKSGNRDKVIIQGDAMTASARVKNLIRVGASDFILNSVTLQKSGWHLLQIAGELNADRVRITNVVFRDAYEQMLKVSIDQSNYSLTSDNGVIEDSLFEYTAGTGPQYYIGGIDIHGGKNWVVRKNIFQNIISPSQTVAEFAIHLWNQSADAIVEKNLIINCDRGIGFGLDERGNSRGIIRNNIIYHAANAGQFADVGIYLEHSPGTQIYNNTIFQEHSYPRSIEYRFATSSGVLITNNLTNKPILARDGALGTETSNLTTAAKSWFLDPASGNLHLAGQAPSVVDKGQPLAELSEDYDGQPRPQGAGIDIGADEWTGPDSTPVQPPLNLRLTK